MKILYLTAQQFFHNVLYIDKGLGENTDSDQLDHFQLIDSNAKKYIFALLHYQMHICKYLPPTKSCAVLVWSEPSAVHNTHLHI